VPADALALVLTAAVLHAGWNVLLRGSEDVEARTAVVLALAVVLFAPVAVVTWSVSWSVAPYVAASAGFEALYFALLVAAYRRRELSVVYPIARGSAPLIVLLGSAVVLGRHMSAGAAAGVCLVAVGVVLVRGVRRGADGVLVALAIGCAIAAYTLVDKDGLQHAGTLPYLELVLAPVALVAIPVVARRRGTAALRAQLTVSTLIAAVARSAPTGSCWQRCGTPRLPRSPPCERQASSSRRCSRARSCVKASGSSASPERPRSPVASP
jgi:drug/metabolite transporter (DMT)-like permease